MPLEMEGLGLEGMREIIGWLGEKRLTIIRRGLARRLHGDTIVIIPHRGTSGNTKYESLGHKV